MATLKLDGTTKYYDRNIDNIVANNVIISDLPDSYLRMKVRSGTKIRNVLGYALKLFPHQYCTVIWTGTGQVIEKVISCVELFKKKIPGLYQFTKLHYVESKAGNVSIKRKQVPEINIVLSKATLNDFKYGIFQDSTIDEGISQASSFVPNIENTGLMSSSDTEEFATMEVKISQKRLLECQTSYIPKSKKINSRKSSMFC